MAFDQDATFEPYENDDELLLPLIDATLPLTIRDDSGDDTGDEDNDFQESNEVAQEACPLSDPAQLPLYADSKLTISSSSVLIQKYAMRHNLTKEALLDLMKLLKLHCPSPNLCLSSVYHLQKQFPNLKYEAVFHYFCSNCLNSVTSNSKLCPNTACGVNLTVPNSISSFIELPLKPQFKVIIERDGINLLQYSSVAAQPLYKVVIIGIYVVYRMSNHDAATTLQGCKQVVQMSNHNTVLLQPPQRRCEAN